MTAATEPRRAAAVDAPVLVFTLPREVLVRALTRASLAVPRTSTALLVLTGVRIERVATGLRLTTSDLERWIVTDVPIEGIGLDGADAPAVVLPCHGLLDLVASLPPTDVTIAVHRIGDRSKARISAGRSRFELLDLPVSEWPTPDPLRAEIQATVEAGSFARAFAAVATHASQEKSRPVMNGVVLDGTDTGLYLAATDEHQLACIRIAAATPLRGQWIIHRTAAEVIRKLFEAADTMQIAADATRIRFSVPGTALDLRLVGGPYPPYRRILGVARDQEAVCDRHLLLAAIKRVSALPDVQRVTLEWRATEVVVRAESAKVGHGEDALPCTLTAGDGGEPRPVCLDFQPHLIVGSLNILNGSEVRVRLKGPVDYPYFTDFADPAQDVIALTVPTRPR